MKKFLLAFMLAFAGCLNTQTKMNLARPDFSKPRSGCCAPVKTDTSVAPVQTKTAMVDDGDVDEMNKEVDKWFQENPDYDTRSRTF